MKKIWFVLLGSVLTFHASCVPLIEGQQYLIIDQPLINEPQVLEFFSFYCPHCYQFERIYHIYSNLKKSLRGGTKITKYHVNFLGPLGKQLSKAWAMAMALGIEDKVSPLMFDAVQKTQTLKTTEDIRRIFIQAGVNPEEYDATCNSFLIQSLTTKQEKAANKVQLRGVPVMFVKGKYMIRSEGLDMSSIDAYSNHLTNVVNFLLTER